MQKKSFDKLQHPFMIKKLPQNMGIEGKYFNIIKARCGKPTAKIMLKVKS